MDDGGTGGGSGEDPFDSLLPLCHVSASQEERLWGCPFAPERYDDESEESGGGGIPIASTPIMLVSPPESEEEEENEFHTPPEEAAISSSNENRPAEEVDGREGDDGERRSVEEERDGVALAVDLSGDSELGFSEAEAAQRENPNLEASGAELRENRVLMRELCLDDGLVESPLKKLKISERNPEGSGVELEVAIGTPSDRGFDFQSKRRPAKRKLELSEDENSAEVIRLESEANDGISERNAVSNGHQERISAKEFIEAMDVLRHDSTGETQETENYELRKLPSSILGPAENAAEAEGGERDREVTILDVLKLLAEDRDDDAPSCSLLEICKRRGMTFPRPAWWSEKGTGFGDDDMEVSF